jgi:hypothetical protein
MSQKIGKTCKGKNCKNCIKQGKLCYQHEKIQSPKTVSSTTKLLKSGKKQGCSNAGKYPNVPAHLFCGAEGGSCFNTYPVNNPGRARAALSYARFAPNPQGIRNCVNRIKKEKGW